MHMLEVWGCHAPNAFDISGKLVKSQSFCKIVRHSIFGDLFVLVKVVGQMVKTPPP